MAYKSVSDLSEPIEIMVWISNPDDFVNWSDQRKLARYKKVMKWHDYTTGLYKLGKITHLWGSHQCLSRAKFTSSLGLLIAVYKVDSWREFDELLLDDPLRDVSQYNTTPLSGLLDDKGSDFARYEHHKRIFLGDNPDPTRLRVYEEYRARFNNPPDYVGKQSFQAPENPRTFFQEQRADGDPLEILLLGVNPPEYITDWDDLRKLVHHEKVMWWHDYMSLMIKQKKISHAWGTNDFCYIAGANTNSAAALAIYRVDTFEEFNELYRMDPIRDCTVFWSVMLQPITDQRLQDAKRLRNMIEAIALNPFEDTTDKAPEQEIPVRN